MLCSRRQFPLSLCYSTVFVLCCLFLAETSKNLTAVTQLENDANTLPHHAHINASYISPDSIKLRNLASILFLSSCVICIMTGCYTHTITLLLTLDCVVHLLIYVTMVTSSQGDIVLLIECNKSSPLSSKV